MTDTNEPMVTCPKCKAPIKLTETLAAPFIEAARTEFTKEADRRETDISAREEALKTQAAKLEQDRKCVQKLVDEQVEQQRKALTASVREKIQRELGTEMSSLQEELDDKDKKLAVARKAELDLRKQQRELEDQRRELDLQKQRELDEERDKIRQATLKEAQEQGRLREKDKDKTIADLLSRVDEMKRKAEQGSQQSQGEVMELELENLLQRSFPGDAIEEVPKGVRGGDIIQRVCSSAHVACGAILWESKRTRNWSNGWLAKLRQDQRDAKAAVSILVTQAMPPGVEGFELIEGVWVTSWPCAVGLATALRQGLVEVASARRSLEGQQSKTEQVYKYLASPAFRNRVQGMVEAVVTMKQDLDKEKRAYQAQWAKREKQLEQVIMGTAGMYGDFQGIIGATLPEIEGISLPAHEPLLDQSMKRESSS